MNPIQRLEEHVIAQIAAGEVVERPASVVKELIENALDAQATYIQVDIERGGQQLIRISDDGHGIPSHEMPLAIARHATSKLRTADDLYRIATLGFRGEALSSVVAVSKTTITTRHRTESIGTQLRIEAGNVTHHREVGAPAGTVITVENLFYNMPVRLKFLKTENTEKRQIMNIVTQYAMAYPDVRFVLVQDNREVFRSSGSGQLADVVVKVFGLAQFKQMIEVRGQDNLDGLTSTIHIEGYISEPNLDRKDRNRIILFVNGRAIQDSTLTYAITQAYHNLLPKGRYPLALLMIQVPPEFVDVNVHPTKAEVRFRDANTTFIALQRVIRHALMNLDQQNMPRFNQESRRPQAGGWALPSVNDGDDLPLEALDEWGNATSATPTDPTAIPTGLGRPERPRTLPPLRIVGQVGASYIVAEGPAGLYLIDQHTAHMRVLYQQLLDERDGQGIQWHEIESRTINFSQKEARTIETIIDALAQAGIQIEPFGTTAFVVRTVPVILSEQFVEDAIASLLDEWMRQNTNAEPLDLTLLIIARYSAYRSGRILKQDEMAQLVQNLERCPSPQTSPDDRPTLIHISADQLADEFKRPPT